MKYKIVMEGINEYNDILMVGDLTKEEAEKFLKHYEEKDNYHYYAIKEDL